MNRELSDVQAGFRKGSGTRHQIANICQIFETARKFQKNIYFCFIDDAKAFYCVDHNKLWKILKEMGIPDHLTCLLQNLYAGQEIGKVEKLDKWMPHERPQIKKIVILKGRLLFLYATTNHFL